MESGNGEEGDYRGALAEALAQRAATSEILRVIAATHDDFQPVFEVIARSAVRLCDAHFCAVFRYDGELIHLVAHEGLTGHRLATWLKAFPTPAGRGSAIGRAILDGTVAQVPDVFADDEYRYRDVARAVGFRSIVGVPLQRAGRPVGGIALARATAGELPQPRVELLETFADQAAIAIENVRLFREIEAQSRQLELASRHKSAFLANMSHELRTPLNAIIGFTRIVLRRSQDRLDAQQYENLQKILASALHLLSLINAVLDLARIEAGRIDLKPVQLPLAPLLAHCLRTVESLVADDVRLVAAWPAELPMLEADEEKLRQILINLLSNAAKFTPSGRIELRAASAAGRIEIAVADTGIGIPADKWDTIFEEFEQLPGAAGASAGSGLGLAIARRLARLMGGDIGVDSTLGAGSTFTLRLPLGPPPCA